MSQKDFLCLISFFTLKIPFVFNYYYFQIAFQVYAVIEQCYKIMQLIFSKEIRTYCQKYTPTDCFFVKNTLLQTAFSAILPAG